MSVFRFLGSADVGRSNQLNVTHQSNTLTLSGTRLAVLALLFFFLVATPERSHPFPSRTRKLSSPGPMVLQGQPCGRVGRCRGFEGSIERSSPLLFFGCLADFAGARASSPGAGWRLSVRLTCFRGSAGLPPRWASSWAGTGGLDRSRRFYNSIHKLDERMNPSCGQWSYSAISIGIQRRVHDRDSQCVARG